MVGMTLPRRPSKRKLGGRHPQNALTPAFVRNVSRAGRYCDGNGLYLDVRPTGSRGWIQRLTIRGRRTELWLGGFPLVSLKEAREKAFANRKLARDGGDPLADKRRAESTPTFEEAGRQVWNQLRPGWRSPQHAQLWLGSLERHVFPRIGKMPISEVTSADVVGILAPIWHDKPGRRLLDRAAREMGKARRGLRPRTAEQLPNHWQRPPKRQRLGGEAVSEVMDANIDGRRLAAVATWLWSSSAPDEIPGTGVGRRGAVRGHQETRRGIGATTSSRPLTLAGAGCQVTVDRQRTCLRAPLPGEPE